MLYLALCCIYYVKNCLSPVAVLGQSLPSHPISLRSTLMPFMIMCSKWSLSFRLPTKKPVFFLFYSMRATCTDHPIVPDLITIIIFGEGCKSRSSWLCSFFQPIVISSLSCTKEVYCLIYLTLYCTP